VSQGGRTKVGLEDVGHGGLPTICCQGDMMGCCLMMGDLLCEAGPQATVGIELFFEGSLTMIEGEVYPSSMCWWQQIAEEIEPIGAEIGREYIADFGPGCLDCGM